MAENLLSYQGNAGLGLGSNPGIPAPDNVPLRQIGQAARDIMLLDNQWNVMRYQQKKKDQAELRDAIDKGQVAKGEILPEYQPAFDAARQKVTDYYKTNGQDLINNPEKYREYQSLVQNLKDVSTHAQVNTHGVQLLEKQKAEQTLPTKQAKIQKFIDEQKGSTKKDFWNQVHPYQQMHDLKISDITDISPNAVIKTTRQDPTDPLKSYDVSVVDYDQILKEKVNDFVNDTTGEKADSQSQWIKKLQDYDPIKLGETLNGMDAQIDKYNKERGFKKGMPGFVDYVKRAAVGPQLIIKESIPELAAKYALANQSQFVHETPKTDYKLGALQVAKERANADAAYKRVMAANSGARTRAYVDNVKSQLKARKSPEDKDAFANDMYDGIITNQPTLIEWKKGLGTFKKLKVDETIPVFSLDGKVPKKLPGIGATLKNKSYEGGEYEPQYKKDGKIITPKNVAADYVEFKQLMKDSKLPWNGSIDDFIKESVKNKYYDFSIKGQGVVDRKLNTAAQRAISNADTQKGETPIFEPEQDNVPDEKPNDNPIE